MSAPTNLTPEAATVITALPYDATIDVTDAPTGSGYVSTCDSTQYHAVWYAITTGILQRQLVFSVVRDGAGNYAPRFSVWTGALGSLTQYAPLGFHFCAAPSGNVYYQVPVQVSTTYYLQVTDVNNTNPVGSLRLRMVVPPYATVPAGSLLISDDTAIFFGSGVSATDGSVLRYLADCPPGEVSDTVPTGEMCFQDINTEDDSVVTVVNKDFTQLAQHDFVDEVKGIKSDRAETFYIITKASGAPPLKVHTITTDGTIGGTTWTLPADSIGAGVFAVTRESPFLLYYARRGSADTIHCYNLTTDAAAADLHVGFVGERAAGQGDGYVDEDGNIVLAFQDDPGTGAGRLRWFQPDGTVLGTYSLTHANFVTFDHVAIGIGAAADQDLWVFGFYSTGHLAAFQHLKLSDGSLLDFIDAVPVATTSGHSDTVDTPYPISDSCPLLVLTQTIQAATPPPPPGVPRMIRRVRRFPLPFSSNLRMFFARLEIELQAGVGLTSGQGSDPQLMIRISKDGGQTWGNERWISAGAMGQYGQRAFLNRLGSMRNGVCEVVVTDPVAWGLMAAYVDGSEGSS